MRLCAGSRAKRTLGGFGYNLFFEFSGLSGKLLVRSGAQKRVNAAAVNSWLFNKDTVDKVLQHLMENGHKVLCVEVEARGRQFWELNNPEDVPRIEAMMAEMGTP